MLVAQAEVQERGTGLVTSEPVLVETLNGCSLLGPHYRRRTVEIVFGIIDGDEVEVIWADEALFRQALRLYADRPDQSYSLTDCQSMVIMRERGLQDVLTGDHHFEQEGFRVLIS